MTDLFPQVESIAFVDIGCSGSLDAKWSRLYPLLDYTGLDANAAECARLAAQPHPYRSARYLAYAVAGEEGTQTLRKTESPFCCSLLRPNHPWLERFSFHDLFRETGLEPVPCTTLDALSRSAGLRADILKLDTQGLELPVLEAGESVLATALCVETETGFVENYVGETTFSQVDAFLRPRGFIMADIAVHRVGRGNALGTRGTRQPLWCEATWMYDFVGAGKAPQPGQAERFLAICRALGFFDLGLELAAHVHRLGTIDDATLAFLGRAESWEPPPRPKAPASRTGRLLRLLPKGINLRLWHGLREIME